MAEIRHEIMQNLLVCFPPSQASSHVMADGWKDKCSV